ncbi:TonB-linked SusC/RagA family outer membrane protein [Dysgonomonas alginatilytica]|uniref:TonB-linked SusC/RagA family outer membrane protein n=1 Tax=Dysgonomonas alginatilytica TaxID=1605892 RepID=A0A2V3PT13_9BACT|nr:TonB-dependent receptor [Dysgonomonas alginatilytica]PXV68753.1 TonB-linked SusC/RagA family outer membrane protein [Dysgonomonas alginatilytica]
MKNTWSFLLIPKIFMLLTLGLLCLSAQNIAAQSSKGSISGTVIDSNKDPLIGVAIHVLGTSKGTITDLDGNYTIEIDNPKSILRFSYTGFVSREIPVENNRKIDVTLSEDLQQLDEVVVVGYGIQRKSHLTGSITKVKTDGLEDIPASRVDQALQGRIAGVQIQNVTSEVGEAPKVKVRGMGSISAGAEPLIIVDGFPVAEGLGVVNMNDVESIEVLKDAASAAIYGSRAANGVIMITTKQGTINKPKYTLRTLWGTKSAYKVHPIMTSKEYVDMRTNEERLKGSKQLPDAELAFLAIENNTDWQDEGLRSANIYNIQLGISGGSKDVKYYISGSHIKDQGIMIKNEYEKTNIRVKVDANLSKRVVLGVNIAPTYANRQRPTTNFIDFYRTPSWMPVKHTAQTAALTGYEEGSYANGAHFNNKNYTVTDPITGEERTIKASPFNTANHNPRMILDNESSFQKDYRLQSSAYLNINLMKGLDFKTSNGFDIVYNDIDIYRNKASRKDGETNRGLYQNNLLIDLITENTLTYATKINKSHDINILLGASAQKTTQKQAGILGINFSTDRIQTLNAAGSIVQSETTSSGINQYTGTWRQEHALVSYFSRFTYAYEDRYLMSASIRTDGSSKFGKDNQWGWFPSISLGWRPSEEAFIKNNPDFAWLNQLKVRTSYGVTGTNSIPNYANTDKLQSANYIWGTGNGTVGAGLANNSLILGNSKLRWEQTNEYNAGLDLSVFNSRIGLNLDLYYSTTKSLLFAKNINSISGYLRGWSNEGKLRNKGIEIEMTTFNVQNKDFTWNTSLNFSKNDNKLLDLGGSPQLIFQGERNEMYISRIGGPTIQFYGFKTIGVWKSQEEIDSNPHHLTDAPGGLRVQNTNGDNVIDDNDMVPLGNPFPDFSWGINNNLKYKDIDLSFLVQGAQGVDVWNGDEYYNETRKWNRNYVTNRWVNADNPGDGKTPYFNNGIDHFLTDHAIQDGSYIALRDITIGYTLPKKFVKKAMLSRMRVFTSIQNLGYWFTGDYKGINPEARLTSSPYDSPLISGYQRGAFPLQRTFSFGIDINF